MRIIKTECYLLADGKVKAYSIEVISFYHMETIILTVGTLPEGGHRPLNLD